MHVDVVGGPSSRMCRLHGLMSKVASDTVDACLRPPKNQEAIELCTKSHFSHYSMLQIRVSCMPF